MVDYTLFSVFTLVASDVEAVGSAVANPFELLAKSYFQSGEKRFHEGRYDDAIFAWRQAWELSKRPLLLYNIAFAHEKNGDLTQAIATFKRYRAIAPESEQKELSKRILSLQSMVQEQLRIELQRQKILAPNQKWFSPPAPSQQPYNAGATWQFNPILFWSSLSITGLSGATTLWFQEMHHHHHQHALSHCADLLDGNRICNSLAQQHISQSNNFKTAAMVGYGMTTIGLVASLYFTVKQLDKKFDTTKNQSESK